MKSIVVSVDDTSWSDTAVRWTTAVAAARHAPVVLVATWQPAQVEFPPVEDTREHAVLDAALRTVAAQLPADVVPRRRIVAGAPPDALLRAVRHDDADLLVVGMPGYGLDLYGAGTVADTLARSAACPLVLVPNGAPAAVRRILLGLDASEASQQAAQWCAAFAADLHAEVVAVHVYTEQFDLVPETDSESMFQYWQQSVTGPWTQPLRDAGVSVRPDIVHGDDVTKMLVATAVAEAADLIVVGGRHRHRGPDAHETLRLVHATPVPLALIPV